MRVMAIVKATKDSEAGILPKAEEFAAMGKFNEELVNAGILLGADGLKASSKGARVRYGTDKPTVLDGPFAETKELVSGFWILQVKSLEEAKEWIKRAPMPSGSEVELRPFFEAEDFAEVFTPA